MLHGKKLKEDKAKSRDQGEEYMDIANAHVRGPPRRAQAQQPRDDITATIAETLLLTPSEICISCAK